jgi:ATP-dependent helicase/nuclease subunit A
MRNDASGPQIDAASPDRSVWVSANAGSGKTRVLTDRVARLLLRGVDPQNILCLTYTKAAATEMQNRLFQRLGGWAMAKDHDLIGQLVELGEAPDPADLNRARRLFARAIETPGGLRIQTIHSFCAAILRRFPMEAGVPPGFVELDERSAAMLRLEVLEALASREDSAGVMHELSVVGRQTDLGALAAQAVPTADRFLPARSDSDLARSVDHDPDLTEADILSLVFLGGEADLLARAAKVLSAMSVANDPKLGAKLQAVAQTALDVAALARLDSAFLNEAGVPKANTPTKGGRAALGGDEPAFRALMERVAAARTARLRLQSWRFTCLHHRFARAFLVEYYARKADRGWLDFDDLIRKAEALLTDTTLAAWVLFRLDGGIDHILIDEAQDTSPRQWRVIRALTAEFTAGQGARAVDRTLFVVGDKKQSIYSFQGADVAVFDRERADFETGFARAQLPFQTSELAYSFRSSPAVLQAVDATFQGRITDDEGRDLFDGTLHRAYWDRLPGQVDLWPLIDPVDDKADDREWDDPVDLMGSTHHYSRLATQIAGFLRQVLDGQTLPDRKGDRPLTAGDVLILVQRRNALFHAIIRACKEARIPIAGADRMQILDEIAVKDVVALLSFLVTPEDDLSLAAALRSPLLGLDEAGLFALAHGRKGYLWEAMRAQRDAHAGIMAVLDDLRGQAEFLRPYEVIERLLTRHRGRENLLARLGPECEEAIDELLTQALSYETIEPPSLAGFLVWLTSGEVEVKRQAEGGSGKLRVMTVHGAKGLEAPMVILADTVDRRDGSGRDASEDEEGTAIWGPKTAAVEAARDRKREANWEESLRLLYVAMTRAQNWLVVAGAGKALVETKEGPRPSRRWAWYRQVEAGLQVLGAVAGPDGVVRHGFGAWPVPSRPSSGLGDAAPLAPLPDWFTKAAAKVMRAPQPLSPSDLGGAKVMPGEADGPGDKEDALARGTAIHLLLEHLPGLRPEAHAGRAARLIPDATLCRDALAEVQGLLSRADLAPLFAADALAEVALTAPIGDRVMQGAVDRLILDPGGPVLAVDFKSNRLLPGAPDQVPEGILRQMGAYLTALQAIYPGRQVETAILWTRRGQLMRLDSNIVRQAFERSTIA